MLRTDIGEGDAALQCTTNSTACCTNNFPEMRGGDYYYPDGGGVVPTQGGATNGYYRDRQSGHIRLNRQNTGTINGQFRCEIPSASGVMMTLYINIGEYMYSVLLLVDNV